MLRFCKAAAPWSAGLAMVLASSTASAQFWRSAFGGNNCDCAPAAASISSVSYQSAPAAMACSVCAPVVQAVSCAPPTQAVMQTVYKEVPVVEHVAVKQTVKKPIVETAWVDQPVTEYRQVSEMRTMDVPTVHYQDVQECQTVTKNMGYWRTQSIPNPKANPCEYNHMPGFSGWMTRQSVELRNAFTPNYTTRREYVPQTIVQAVPVTRRMAVQGTKQVSYNVSSMVPYQTTRKVAVASTKWVDEEVTVMKPQTVMKTMAVGRQIAYLPVGAGTGTASALQPSPDAIGSSLTPTQKAQSTDKLQQANPNNPTDRRINAVDPQPQHQRSKLVPTGLPKIDDQDYADLPVNLGKPSTDVKSFAVPTAARFNQWVARGAKSPTPSSVPSAISVADTDRP
ncbi:MAG TPA: hypothetical protein VFG20_17800 [Planctomycetaceae bacterium]|nr:hypothetical protein [Planctomycetaceae bacterium]